MSDRHYASADEIIGLTRSFISHSMDLYLRLLQQKRLTAAGELFRATLVAVASLNTDRKARLVSAALIHRVALMIVAVMQPAGVGPSREDLDAFDAAADLCGALSAPARPAPAVSGAVSMHSL